MLKPTRQYVDKRSMAILATLLIAATAWAGEQLELSGVVRPAFDLGLTPFRDGIAVKNAGNAVVLFQIGQRDQTGHTVAWLRQNELMVLRTDYVQNLNAPVEIRILAP